MDYLHEAQIHDLLPTRPADSHKGTFGRTVVVGGQYGMAGAPLLATRAALRCGVGLAEAAVPHSIYPILAGAVPEAIFTPLPENATGQLDETALPPLLKRLNGASSLVLGCGLGQGTGVRALVRELLTATDCPLVLDADGINAVDAHILSQEEGHGPRILTPHPGEMARLCGLTVANVQADRVELATKTAREWQAVVALKGHHTIIAGPDGRVAVNPTGNPGMATGGSGDVLAGMIGGLLAQGVPPWEAAATGAYLHGLAGDRAAKGRSQTALLPSDIIDELCSLFVDWGL